MAIEHAGRTILCVEDLHHDQWKGIISVVEVTPAGPAGPLRCVLKQP